MKVEWGDAWASSGWREHPSESVTAVPCQSVGIVLSHDKEGILLAGTVTLDDSGVGHGGRHGFIPTGMIRKIKVLK